MGWGILGPDPVSTYFGPGPSLDPYRPPPSLGLKRKGEGGGCNDLEIGQS